MPNYARQFFRLATINTRTLLSKSRQVELESALSNVKWDLIALTEARIKGIGSFTLVSSKSTVFHSGGTSARNGVAFLLRSTLASEAEFRPVNDRLATLYLRNHRLFVVVGYAPTSASTEKEYDQFLDQVEIEMNRAPRGSIPLLLGDFNAKVMREAGNESFVGPYASSAINHRGRALVEAISRMRLRMVNTFFAKRKMRRWTWRSPNGATFNQIDYIIAPASTSITDCDVVPSLNFNSDHRMVRAVIDLGFQAKKRKRRGAIRFELDREEYAANVRLLSTLPLPYPTNAEEAYRSIVAFTSTAAVGCWRKKKKRPWMSANTSALLSRRYLLKNDPTRAADYNACCREARLSLQQDISRRLEEAAVAAALKGRSVSTALRTLKHTQPRLLIQDNSTGTFSQKYTTEAVKEFYEDLYEPKVCLPIFIPPSEDALPEFLPDEAELALKKLKMGHAAGTDFILPDQLVIAREQLSVYLADLLNHLVTNDAIPPNLVTSAVSLIHKKGSTSNISNYRPISLLTVTLKAATSVVLERIAPMLKHSFGTTQTGFRKDYGTTDNIHVIRQITEKCTEYNMEVYYAMIDFEKAFDSIEWPALWQSLRLQNIHSDLIRLLRRLYEESTTFVRVNEDLVKVNVRRGVKQVDAISPILFNSTLAFAVNTIDWEEDGINIDGVRLSHLEYADDIILVAKSRPELEKMIRKLSDAASRVGLKINSKKSHLLTSCTTSRSPILIDGMTFNFVESTIYLGSRISFPLDPVKDIDHRVQCAWMIWSKLSNLLASRLLPMNSKRRLFESCITSTVLYGCEAWSLRDCDKERLRVVQRKMERRMIGVTRLDRWSNERIRRMTCLRDWIDEATKRKCRWSIRIREMEDDRWARRSTYWIPYTFVKRRSPGQPRVRWRDEFKRINVQWWSIPLEELKNGPPFI